MKFARMIILFLMAFFLLMSCGGHSGSSKDKKQEETGKDLFSVWTGTADGEIVDLTGLKFDTPSSILSVNSDGSQCSCTLLIRGNQTSGTFSFTNCFYAGGGNGDPGCGSGNVIGKYSKTSDTLTACNPQCSTYK